MNWKEIIDNNNRFFWLLHTGGWLSIALVYCLGSMIHRDTTSVFIIVLLLNSAVGWLISLSLRYFYRWGWNFSPVKLVILVILACYSSGLLLQVIKNFNYMQIYKQGAHAKHWYDYLKHSVGSMVIMLSWSGLYFGIKYYQMLQIARQNVLKANNMAHQAQLKMLRYQLNPHFLFNTLNAISTLILVNDNKIANAMVTKLSDFLRYSLDKDPMKKVSLTSEIHALGLYLDIEKVRFEERLQINYHIDEQCKQALVPSMMLQPLAENAIKYAVAVQEQGGIINVSVGRFGNDLLIEVADNGPGADIKQSNFYREKGVGLVNTRERLLALYQDNFSLVVTNNQPTGVKVSIRMPFEIDDLLASGQNSVKD